MSRKDRPIITDSSGVRRFKENTVVRYLLDEATAGRKCDMNHLAVEYKVNRRFTQQDWTEFYQLIGYSLSGYGEVFPRSKVRE